ncbi:MAG: hypothetical protein K1X53_03555 [Candidatus Sumerlaeaceae bacterium]|nr:hypothetical protein [Candidatus Sumerlaeaceae bacterium]
MFRISLEEVVVVGIGNFKGYWSGGWHHLRDQRILYLIAAGKWRFYRGTIPAWN